MQFKYFTWALFVPYYFLSLVVSRAVCLVKLEKDQVNKVGGEIRLENADELTMCLYWWTSQVFNTLMCIGNINTQGRSCKDVSGRYWTMNLLSYFLLQSRLKNQDSAAQFLGKAILWMSIKMLGLQWEWKAAMMREKALDVDTEGQTGDPEPKSEWPCKDGMR